MSDLIANVIDGKVDSPSSLQEERKVGSQLGKDDFLLLLVTQMKYQDPLEPTSNTEYVAQLAQFTELEYMQNMTDVTQHTSAFSLVGRYVYVSSTGEGGHHEEAEGVVDFVNMKNGEAFVSINGTEYSYDDIVKVIDSSYVIMQKLPSVKEQVIKFLHHDPQNIVINGVSLGEDEFKAGSIGIGIVDAKGETTTIDPKYVSFKDGVVTINKDAVAWMDAGTYNIAFVFDDPNKTVSYKDVTLVIKGMATAEKPVKPDKPDDSSNGENNSGDSTTTGGNGTDNGGSAEDGKTLAV